MTVRIAVLADIHGNLPALRAVLAELDREHPAAQGAAWSAEKLTQQWRDELASWPIALSLDGVLFCHGSPRRDDEILTRTTPPEVLSEALAGVTEALVVGGHTHQQVIRSVRAGLTYANAGSVGMPYEGRPGAFWMTVVDGTARPRETPYDLAAALEELNASGYPGLEEQVRESLIEPVDVDWVSAFFEHGAGRGEDPGDPPRHHVHGM